MSYVHEVSGECRGFILYTHFSFNRWRRVLHSTIPMKYRQKYVSMC